MKTYQIQIRKSVKKDLKLIKDFIVEKSNREHAIKYAADFIKISEWRTGKKFSK